MNKTAEKNLTLHTVSSVGNTDSGPPKHANSPTLNYSKHLPFPDKIKDDPTLPKNPKMAKKQLNNPSTQNDTFCSH